MEEDLGEEKITVCRLCLKIKNKSNCEPFQQGFFVELLEQLSVKVDLLNIADPVICDNCSVKLQELTQFKVLCSSFQKIPHPAYNITMESCIICMKTTKNNCMLDNVTKMYGDALLNKYIPALDYLNRSEICICQSCYNHLQTMDDFIASNEEIEKKIKNYMTNNRNSKYSLNMCEILPYLLENQLDDECDSTMNIVEEINVEEDVNPALINSIDLILKSDIESQNKIKNRINPAKLSKKRKKEKHADGFVMYKTDKGERKYKCLKCTYENQYKWQVVRHLITHKSITEVEHFKCKECDFVTKYKASLIVHDLVHRSTQEIPMYKCPLCDYQAKIRRNVLNHSIVHKSWNEIPIYRCDECSFYTRFKPSLTKHKLTHRDIMEVQMFQCAECIYVTKFKKNLKKHMYIHKNPIDIKMYNCDECSFSTRFPYSLKKHAVIHKDPSEIDMYKCSLCSYQTKFKYSLKRHNLIHKSPSEIVMYQCDHCPYQSKLKANLEAHCIRHQPTEEKGMYKCQHCSYQCKFKYAITTHTVLHTNNTQDSNKKCNDIF